MATEAAGWLPKFYQHFPSMALVLAECRRRNLTVFREDAGEVVTVAETALLRDRGDRLVALKQIQSGEFQFFLQNKVLRSNRETAVELLMKGPRLICAIAASLRLL